MKSIAIGLATFALLAGCKGAGKKTSTPVVDSGVDAPFVADSGDSGDSGDSSIDTGPVSEPDAGTTEACNPLAAAGMQGCSTGQKCTWIVLVDDADALGKLGCVPDGTEALGAACSFGEAGEATGFDSCGAGGYCIGGVCQDICGLAGQSDSACAPGYTCSRYATAFANGDDDPAFGACNPTCDPLTQLVTGTKETCGAGKGCYLLSSETGTLAVCAGAGPSTNVHNVQIRPEGSTSPVYVNACAPGYMPREATQGTAPAIECGGLCKPAPVYADTPATGTTAAMDGMNDGRAGRPNYEGGDTRAMNWMGEPATCANAAGGADSLGGATVDPANPTTGESCQFYYMREFYAGTSDYSNALGSCFQFRQSRYDGTPPTDGSTPERDTPWPSCRDLNRGSPALPADVSDGAAYFGCVETVPVSLSLRPSTSRHPRPARVPSVLKLDRLAPPAR